MPAARYWRVVGIESYSGDGLELSELHLYDAGGRVDALATLTCTHTPVSGALANINDADTATTVGWLEPAIRAPGFALAWDFGAGVTKDCTGVRVGSGADPTKFLAGLTLECLAGGVWAAGVSFNRFPWPGVSTLGAVPGSQVFEPKRLRTIKHTLDTFVAHHIPGSVGAKPTGLLAPCHDVEFGGVGRVRNTVKEKGETDTPVHRRVRLVRECDGLVLREQWSDPVTGEYDFQFVDELQTYTVLSYDHTRNFRAVIADGLTLANGTVELMP